MISTYNLIRIFDHSPIRSLSQLAMRHRLCAILRTEWLKMKFLPRITTRLAINPTTKIIPNKIGTIIDSAPCGWSIVSFWGAQLTLAFIYLLINSQTNSLKYNFYIRLTVLRNAFINSDFRTELKIDTIYPRAQAAILLKPG